MAVLPGFVEEKNAMKTKYERRQRMIHKIAAAQLLHKEIAKTDPNLASVASFMSSVCGNNPDLQKVRETAQVLVQKGVQDMEVTKESAASSQRLSRLSMATKRA